MPLLAANLNVVEKRSQFIHRQLDPLAPVELLDADLHVSPELKYPTVNRPAIRRCTRNNVSHGFVIDLVPGLVQGIPPNGLER
jgi:hypothetical protein